MKKKNCFIFVLSLLLILVGGFIHSNYAYASTIGDVLTQPEEGWKRYDNTDTGINVNKKVFLNCTTAIPGAWKGTFYCADIRANNDDQYIEFSFYGTKLRVLGGDHLQAFCENVEISFDGGNEWEEYPTGIVDGNNLTLFPRIAYEKYDLEEKLHRVIIKIPRQTNEAQCFIFDAIDIDKDGYLLSSNEQSELIISHSSLTLKIGETERIDAITTPSEATVNWKSSDETIATVDNNGEVTAIGIGKATITAMMEGTELSVPCKVTVIDEEVNQPSNPDIPSIDDDKENGILYIEMVDGNIKHATNIDIDDFLRWYKNRDADKTESPIYKITNAKGNTEYLVHDKIVAFEVRE